MKFRGFHRILGILLILPFLGWVATGLFFFIKPGYKGAYESLKPAIRPLENLPHIQGDSSWLEYRMVRSVLGLHLLVKTRDGFLHLNGDGAVRDFPSEADIKLLVEEAIIINPQRYGQILRVEENEIFMDSGVKITLNWDSLSFYQYGEDTRFIDLMYSVHYLRWTGVKAIDQVMGVVGLGLVLLLTASGVFLLVRGKKI